MWYCQICGEPVTDGVLVCPACGLDYEAVWEDEDMALELGDVEVEPAEEDPS